MSVRVARRILFALLGLYAVSLTWPGLTAFNRIEPYVLGLPFVMFWHALWIVLVGAGLVLLDAAQLRSETSATSFHNATSPDATFADDSDAR